MIKMTLNDEYVVDPCQFADNFNGLLRSDHKQFIDVAENSRKVALCNRFSNIIGPNPSYGYFAMTRGSISELENTDVTLRIETETIKIKQEGLIMVMATGVIPVAPGDFYESDGDAFVVEIADKRYYGSHPWLRLDTPGQKVFNVISPAYGQDQYYTDSLDASLGAGLEIPWNWQAMLEEIWPTWLGDCPTIQNPYTSDPVNFDFRGYTNYQALQIVLGILGKQLSLNKNGSFSLIDSGANNAYQYKNDSKKILYRGALDERAEWIEPVMTYFPKGVSVHFQKTSVNSGSENVFTKESGQWYTDMEHVISVDGTESQVSDSTKVIADSYQQIWDDMPAWVDPYTGVINNLTAITARATERTNEFYQNLIRPGFRMNEVYSQLIDFDICGTLQAVSWVQVQKRGGAFITEIYCHPRKQLRVENGEIVPMSIQPQSPWQWRSAPIYPPETMLWQNDGFLSSGSASGTQDDEYNGHEVRYDPATKTFVAGIYVKGVPTS